MIAYSVGQNLDQHTAWQTLSVFQQAGAIVPYIRVGTNTVVQMYNRSCTNFLRFTGPV
jgi:hypothetical protein